MGRLTKLNLDRSKALAAEIATRSEALEQRIDENVESGRWPDESTRVVERSSDAPGADLTGRERQSRRTLVSARDLWLEHLLVVRWPALAWIGGSDPVERSGAESRKETARIENALRRMLAELRQAGGLIEEHTGSSFVGEISRRRAQCRRQLYERASRVMPGGNTRHSVALAPYPIYARSGSGCRITDVEGEERVDFLNNYTSLILGHAIRE